MLDGVAGICNWAGYGVFDGCEGYLVLGRVWCERWVWWVPVTGKGMVCLIGVRVPGTGKGMVCFIGVAGTWY